MPGGGCFSRFWPADLRRAHRQITSQHKKAITSARHE
jgi:hypothetical protein